jgi:broad specificity polyphosphatase/5'/3'-nucleotidase SurE
MYSLVLGSGGLDSTGFIIMMETLHKLWPKGRHVAIVSEQACPWVGSASNVSNVKATVQHSPDFKKTRGWKDVYTTKSTPMDSMYYGIHNSDELLGFHQQFILVVAGILHGAVVGHNVLHSSAVVAAGVCSRTYGLPGFCIAQQMSKPVQGDVDRKHFQNSARLLPDLLCGMAPQANECLVLNVPEATPQGPEHAIIADYHPALPAKCNPFTKGPKTDIAALENNKVSIAQLYLNFNSRMTL